MCGATPPPPESPNHRCKLMYIYTRPLCCQLNCAHTAQATRAATAAHAIIVMDLNVHVFRMRMHTDALYGCHNRATAIHSFIRSAPATFVPQVSRVHTACALAPATYITYMVNFNKIHYSLQMSDT